MAIQELDKNKYLNYYLYRMNVQFMCYSIVQEMSNMFEEYNKVQEAVLATTLKLLREKDLQATSMSLISKESAISTGSIYYYFKSKEDIINELYRGISKFTKREMYKDFYTDESIQKRFWKFWEQAIRFNINHYDAIQFLEQYSFSSYIDEEIKKDANNGVCEPLAKLYAEAIKQKVFVELEPTTMVLMHYGSVVHLARAHHANSVNLTDELNQKIIQSCWNSVSVKKFIL